MKRHQLHRLLATLALAASASTAFASGSESFSSGPSSDARLYNVGKGVYADKLACSSCPLADKTLTAEVAKAVLNGEPKVDLTNDEAQALGAYLKRRFKI